MDQLEWWSLLRFLYSSENSESDRIKSLYEDETLKNKL